jgi:hypothetical protein
MFIKKRIIVILAAFLTVPVCAAMSVEREFVAFITAGSTIHNYHGICNGGVGQPYADFMHQLRAMAESGDTNRLLTILRRADEHSRDIYDVWLDDFNTNHDAYRKSIDEILK